MQIFEAYHPHEGRYDNMEFYCRCGRSGLMLPRLSLGLWHNFGNITPFDTQRQILCAAFDAGITHFDLANNYGPPYGEAELNFGIHMDRDFRPFRDELVVSTKAGYDMWAGPYGNHGSRKYLIASADQSLKRMHLDYVDIFYHHRPDPETPLEETMAALRFLVDSGRALYVGISNYPADMAAKASQIMQGWGVPLLICQSRYNMFERSIENGLLDTLDAAGMGCIVFQPLAGGMLTNKYLHDIPKDSRAGRDPRYLKPDMITQDKLIKIAKLNELALGRGETLAQMALQWVLRDSRITSALIGASRPGQIAENMKALAFPALADEELSAIDRILES